MLCIRFEPLWLTPVGNTEIAFRVESLKKVVLFIGAFERGDDENELTAENNV